MATFITNELNDNEMKNGHKKYNKIMRIPINDIVMADYQRKPCPVTVQNIVKEYDFNRDRPVEISFRDGKYYCFDGQHRIRAHEIMKHNTVLSQVHYGLTYEDEADLFAKQHRNERRVNTADIWQAAIKSGDKNPEVQDIIRICKEYGYIVTVESFAHKKYKKVFTCVMELQNIYNRHGANGLRLIVSTIHSAWDDLPSATHREIVSALGKMLDIYQMNGNEWERLAYRLSKMTPKAFLQGGNTVDGRGWKRMVKYLVKLYNNGLKLDSNKRLDEMLIR